jgi:uncharacterized protein YndB with AHSA1/START domain
MHDAAASPASPSSDRELCASLLIAAPREQVFAAFLDPVRLARWWGPRGFRNTFAECDPRPGGRYRIEMRHAGGNVHVVHGVYEEVSRPCRLVFSFAWEDRPGDGATRVIARFHEAGTGTRLVIVHVQFTAPEARDAHQGGWNGSLDKLARLFE